MADSLTGIWNGFFVYNDKMKRGTGKVQLTGDANIIIPFLIEQKGLLRKLIKQTRPKPATEGVHDLRVAIRRLRVAVWLAKHDTDMPRFRNLSKTLLNLGEILGSLRQLDVAVNDAKSYRLPVSSLKARRKKARADVARTLTLTLGNLLEKELKRLIRFLRKRGDVRMRKAVSELLERAGAFRGRVPGAKEEFHQFRIFIKKVRYTIEIFGYPPGQIKTLHDLLGKAHDLEILQQLAGENDAVKLDEAKYCGLVAKIAKPVMRFARERLADIAIKDGSTDGNTRGGMLY